jgi:hypothetical protein
MAGMIPSVPQVTGSMGGQIATSDSDEQIIKAMQSQSGAEQMQSMQQMSQ